MLRSFSRPLICNRTPESLCVSESENRKEAWGPLMLPPYFKDWKADAWRSKVTHPRSHNWFRARAVLDPYHLIPNPVLTYYTIDSFIKPYSQTLKRDLIIQRDDTLAEGHTVEQPHCFCILSLFLWCWALRALDSYLILKESERGGNERFIDHKCYF